MIKPFEISISTQIIQATRPDIIVIDKAVHTVFLIDISILVVIKEDEKN